MQIRGMIQPILKMRRTDSAMDTSEPEGASRNEVERTIWDGLDLRVLGVRSGSGLNDLDLALVRYRQDSPNSALCVDLLKVCLFASN